MLEKPSYSNYFQISLHGTLSSQFEKTRSRSGELDLKNYRPIANIPSLFNVIKKL